MGTSRGIQLQSDGLSIDGPSGVGGWLVLPVLGMILTSLVAVFALFRDVIPVFRPQTWSALTTPGSPAYNALWAPLAFFEAVTMLVMTAMPVVLLLSPWPASTQLRFRTCRRMCSPTPRRTFACRSSRLSPGQPLGWPSG